MGSERVSAAEQRLAAAMQPASAAAWDFDKQTGIFLTTAALRQIYGVAPEGPLDLADFIAATHPDDRALWPEVFEEERVPPGGRVHYRILPRPAELRWLASTITVADGGTSFTGSVADVTEGRRTVNALAISEERLRFAIEAGRMAVWEVDLKSGALTNSPELNMLLGLPLDARPTLGDVRTLYAPGEIERIEREGILYEQIRDRAKPTVRRDWVGVPSTDRTQIQFEFAIITPAGTPKQLLLRAQHVPSVDGLGQRVTGVLVDVTDHKLAEDRLALVARELQHRVKNSLAVVQAIALQTFRQGVDPKLAAESFSGRVRALAAATDAILQGGAAVAAMSEVVNRIVAPYRTETRDPFEIDGPPLELSGRAATTLGMAIHELCTNAVKYGSLSCPEGRVAISWRAEGKRAILSWAESGGPPVVPPEHGGFGTRLLRSLMTDGAMSIDYAPRGVRCEIAVPLAEA